MLVSGEPSSLRQYEFNSVRHERRSTNDFIVKSLCDADGSLTALSAKVINIADDSVTKEEAQYRLIRLIDGQSVNDEEDCELSKSL